MPQIVLPACCIRPGLNFKTRREGLQDRALRRQQTPIFNIVDGETTHEIFAIPRILEMVKEVGR